MNLLRKRSKKLSLSQKIILVILSLPFIPQILFCFNSHHDGLILTTVRMLRKNWAQNGEWPFNQYGAFWAFPYTLLTYPLPDHLLLIGLRIVAILSYLLTGFLTWKIASRVDSYKNEIGFFALVIFLASQPFFSGLGMLAWPSAICMPLVAAVALLTMDSIKYFENHELRKGLANIFIVGLVIPFILFSRTQIGIILFLAVAAILVFLRNYKSFILYLLGTFFGLITFLFILWSHGWIRDALTDQLSYGSLYLKTGSVDGYASKPIFTTLGSLAILLTLLNLNLILNILKKLTPRILITWAFLSTLGLYGLFMLVLYRRTPSILFTFTIISRRFWVSIVIGATAYYFIQQVKMTAEKLKVRKKLDLLQKIRNILVLVSIVALLQAYPLMDAAHTWWGAVPAAVILGEILCDSRWREFFSARITTKLRAVLVAILLVMTLGLDLLHFTYPGQKMFPSSFQSGIITDSITVDDEVALQAFFTKNIPIHSRVLNLCMNSDVYFSINHFTPASRLFVVWPNFLEIDSYRKNLTNSTPDYVVSCMPSRILKLDPTYQQILVSNFKDPKVSARWQDQLGEVWTIWKDRPL